MENVRMDSLQFENDEYIYAQESFSENEYSNDDDEKCSFSDTASTTSESYYDSESD